MSNTTYPVEVQRDFLEKITRAQPVQAVAEFIWNSLDADATRVNVWTEQNELGATTKIIVQDDGTGITRSEASNLFTKLGGSWKRSRRTTKEEGRFLHGQEGRGRFKAFALGRTADWDVVYRKGEDLWAFSITMTADDMKHVVISDEKRVENDDAVRGVTLTVSELHREFRFLTSGASVQELLEIFALYLVDYAHTTVSIEGNRLDPTPLIASKGSIPLSTIEDDGKLHHSRLDIIEWAAATNRTLYLCTEQGFPLMEVERRFHVGPFQFSAYVRSSYIEKLQAEGVLELAEMTPRVSLLVNEAREAVRTYFRERAASEARTVVEEWKEEHVYPYEGEAITRVEQVERQVFDIVAVNVAQYLPDFAIAPTKNKALHLRLLRQAIEKSPEELQLILGEVLKLPKRKLEELAQLLRDVSLSAIIGAAKIVADRLHFLTGLEAILFDQDSKRRLKERTQLHRIIAQNCWLFGEEYNLSVDDKSLTEVLRKHRAILGDDTVIDEPVKHVSKARGIVDLVLSRSIKRHRADAVTHLVVELKAPKVKIDKKEIGQVEEYAMSVIADERFRGVNTAWAFWAISDDYGPYAEYRMKNNAGGTGEQAGRIHRDDTHSIWVKTWGQVLEENRARLQFFQEKLEYEADKGASLKYLQERYEQFLQGVIVEEIELSVEPDSTTDSRGVSPPPSRKRRKRALEATTGAPGETTTAPSFDPPGRS